MHIHGMQMNFNQASLQSQATAEKAAAAQRAAEVRKKLLRSAGSVDNELNPDESFMVGRWLDEGSYQGQGRRRHYSAEENQNSDED
jgi:hypothetical protein